MGTNYYLYHEQTRTYINLGKILSSEPRYEGYGDEVAAFMATRRTGDFTLYSDHAELPHHEHPTCLSDIGKPPEWTKVTRADLIPESVRKEKAAKCAEGDLLGEALKACKTASDCFRLLPAVFHVAQAQGELVKMCERALREITVVIAKGTEE